VTINDLTRDQHRQRGIAAVTIRNGFDVHAAPGDRAAQRARLGLAPDELVVVHPVRAIARKDVPAAVALAEALGATYWLTGPAEEGYGPTLDRLLADAAGRGVRVVHEPASSVADLCAAADVVAFPSAWEGFGNPPIEAAFARRPVAVGPYPVGVELQALGFDWFEAADPGPIRAWLDDPDPSTREAMLDTNERVAREWFTFDRMAAGLRALLDEAGWSP
jgi:glycosyltransferase involved in cell wall biosynthesis